MKKIVLLYVLLIISLIGCKNKPDAKISPQSIKDSSLSLRDSLIGKWGGRGESKPIWNIQKDSIYYFAQSAAFPYKIINRDFIIYFPDHSAVLKNIRVDNDTIIFYNVEGYKVRGFRFKQ